MRITRRQSRQPNARAGASTRGATAQQVTPTTVTVRVAAAALALGAVRRLAAPRAAGVDGLAARLRAALITTVRIAPTDTPRAVAGAATAIAVRVAAATLALGAGRRFADPRATGVDGLAARLRAALVAAVGVTAATAPATICGRVTGQILGQTAAALAVVAPGLDTAIIATAQLWTAARLGPALSTKIAGLAASPT